MLSAAVGTRNTAVGYTNTCRFEAHVKVQVPASVAETRASSSRNNSILSIPQRGMVQLKENSPKKVKFDPHEG